MKIVIPTNNKKGLDDKVAKHFGRAKNFLIYDTETKSFDIYSNPEASGGVELPPDFLYNQEVDIIIVFNLGFMAYNKFKSYNIKMYKAIPGNIAANLKKFESDELRILKTEDIF